MSSAPTLGFGCAICSDAFDVNAQRNICAIASCGHVYHEYCVKRWFRTQIQQARLSSCPKCRVPATTNQVVRLFLHQTIADGTTNEFDEDENSDEDSYGNTSTLPDNIDGIHDVDSLVEDSYGNFVVLPLSRRGSVDDIEINLTTSDDEASMPNMPVPNSNTNQQGNDENGADSPAEL